MNNFIRKTYEMNTEEIERLKNSVFKENKEEIFQLLY
jgi:hypothetical protein